MISFFDGLTLRAAARSSVVAVCLALVVWATWWATGYADAISSSTRSGTDIAAIIGAVTAPLALLLNYVFKNYLAAS